LACVSQRPVKVRHNERAANIRGEKKVDQQAVGHNGEKGVRNSSGRAKKGFCTNKPGRRDSGPLGIGEKREPRGKKERRDTTLQLRDVSEEDKGRAGPFKRGAEKKEKT